MKDNIAEMILKERMKGAEKTATTTGKRALPVKNMERPQGAAPHPYFELHIALEMLCDYLAEHARGREP